MTRKSRRVHVKLTCSKTISQKPLQCYKYRRHLGSNLVDVQCLIKHNDGVKYLLTVIHVFPKFLHIVPLLTKTGKALTTAIQTIYKVPKYSQPIRRRPVCLRTDKGSENLDKSFQDMLRLEGIQLQICRNFDVKCSAVEKAQRTI
jgi:hypothetical protein